ncbi:hypothetical protein DPMN_127296 [Dreissena polymorpha]|uniref:Uncharacterized protein n=1 Tax=Dreissena polymorpha TaxID=45954 RepID=A0A9D4GXE1_DREPO|nr:hypothetical protein DPMN_127296 [Dreissena polymorpha]
MGECDNQGPTVTVLYNPQGSVYGGYVSASWISGTSDSYIKDYIQDSRAFLFTDNINYPDYLDTLTEDIVSFKPSGKLRLSDVRILMLGPIGTGKSSFYNTINSVFKGRIYRSAPCGLSTNGITIASIVEYFLLCDTRGLKVTQGLYSLECNYLLDADIPDFYQEVASNITNVFKSKEIEAAVDKASNLLGLPRNHALPVKNYETEMELDDNISILALMALRQVLHFAEDYIQRLSPPYSPDLAPMDFRVFPEVKSQLRGIRFASKQELTVAAKRIVSSFDADCNTLEGVVNKISGLLGLHRNNILKVKNYEKEMELDDNITILALLSLRQLLFYAEDYLQI